MDIDIQIHVTYLLEFNQGMQVHAVIAQISFYR